MTDTNPTIEFRLGQLTGEMGRMADEVRAVRAEGHTREDNILRRIEQHDERDDDRFQAMGARLVTIERTLGVDAVRTEEQNKALERRHDRRNLMHSGMIGGGAAIIGALIAGGLPLLIAALVAHP